jgi:3-hydroxybutyrate dehydrogenase
VRDVEQSRTILITGAGSGLGRGLAVELSRLGHAVIATDQDESAVRETLRLTAEPGRGAAYRLDVTREADLQTLMQQPHGKAVDVLINNAGLQHVAPLETFDQKRWDLLLNVMLRGACVMTRAVLPQMRSRGFGRIIHIGSIHSLVASPFKSAYVAAKHGLTGFSKTIALETADTDITINTICPSYIRTPLVDAQIAAQAAAHHISEQEVIDRIMLDPMPKKAFITAEEVAATIAFLISRAARNITGQTIVIDGGWTAR